MDELDLKHRYRCSKCKNLESHATCKKRKCLNCDAPLTEITEKEFQHHMKKENKKEEENSSQKPKRKLRRNLSAVNIKDKNYKLENEEQEDQDMTYEEKKLQKIQRRRERYKNLELVGPIITKILKHVAKNNEVPDKLMDKFNDIDLSKVNKSGRKNIVVNSTNNGPVSIFVGGKNVTKYVNMEGFKSVFKPFKKIFMRNFNQNFYSSSSTVDNANNYYENVSNAVRNNEQYALDNGCEPIDDEGLSKIEEFKLTNKYCKKKKDGSYELPVCCICLSEIKKGKDTVLLPCGHMFHSKCGKNWLKKNNTCPMCREKVK